MSLVRLISVCFLVLLSISGCSTLKKQAFIVDRDTHYLSAKSIPPLKMPPGASSHTIHSEYPVSEKYYPEQEKSITVIPPGLYDKR